MKTTSKVAIIVAMDKELRLLLDLMANVEQTTADGYTIYKGEIGTIPVSAMKCGIGKVNAALGTDALLRAVEPSLVINTGVAGGVGGDAGILDVVVGARMAYHDVWCGSGTEWGEAAGCPLYFTAPDSVLSLECIQSDPAVKCGLIASGDIFVSRPEEVTRIRETFPEVMAVDMESAAIAQTCYLRGVPMVAVRVVSDTPGGADNIAQYENFWSDAPAHTFALLRRILEHLPADAL